MQKYFIRCFEHLKLKPASIAVAQKYLLLLKSFLFLMFLLLFSTQIDVPYSGALLNGHRCHSRLQSNTQLEGKVSWLLSLE